MKSKLEQLCADMQTGIRQARERGECTAELEKELEQAVDTLLVWCVTKH